MEFTLSAEPQIGVALVKDNETGTVKVQLDGANLITLKEDGEVAVLKKEGSAVSWFVVGNYNPNDKAVN